MKIKRKPDFLVVLAIFVGLGILFSSLSQGLLSSTPSSTITTNNTTITNNNTAAVKLGSSMVVRTPSQGHFVNVSNTGASPDKEAKQQEAFSELQPPTEYLP